MRQTIAARDALMDVIKKVRETTEERDMDAIIDPLEKALQTLFVLIEKGI
jgi:hypothetical protein